MGVGRVVTAGDARGGGFVPGEPGGGPCAPQRVCGGPGRDLPGVAVSKSSYSHQDHGHKFTARPFTPTLHVFLR